MTIIEFFDKESHIDNIVSTLLCKPEKVIFIGDGARRMNRCIEKYKSVAESRGLDVTFETKNVNRNSLMSIVGAIEDVIDENEDCIIDLSGGEDLFLVAVGIVYGEDADRIKLHRFNFSNGSMTDCDSDGILCASEPMEMTVEEAVTINGGRIVFDDEKSNGTEDWDFTEDFIDDVYVMWSICRKNPSRWNAMITTLDRYLALRPESEAECLSVYVNIEEATITLRDKGEKFVVFNDIFKKLSSLNVISNFRYDDTSFSFDFKNRQVMKCLTKAGQVLELLIAIMAVESDTDDGTPFYNDVMTGVSIDWDGEIHPDFEPDIENEIDVILMKGMIPVFISCKNGAITIDELYKLSVVAERFGGKYVRKVLVATELEKMGIKETYIKARADAMGIRILDRVDEMEEETLAKEIKKLWCAN